MANLNGKDRKVEFIESHLATAKCSESSRDPSTSTLTFEFELEFISKQMVLHPPHTTHHTITLTHSLEICIQIASSLIGIEPSTDVEVGSVVVQEGDGMIGLAKRKELRAVHFSTFSLLGTLNAFRAINLIKWTSVCSQMHRFVWHFFCFAWRRSDFDRSIDRKIINKN